MMKVKLILQRHHVPSILITVRNHNEFECKDLKNQEAGGEFHNKISCNNRFLPYLFLIIPQFLQNKILHKRCHSTKSPSHLVVGGLGGGVLSPPAAARSQSRRNCVGKLKSWSIDTETLAVKYASNLPLMKVKLMLRRHNVASILITRWIWMQRL